MPAILTLDSVAVASPDGTRLLDTITLAFGRERTGIVGRNGCGKTTLLRIAAGGIPPAAGTVTRGGTVALLDQDWANPTCTVAEGLGVRNALSVLRRLNDGTGDPGDIAVADWTIETRLATALRDAGLEPDILTRRIDSLSGGERTRLAVVRVTLAAPDLLLLDEPTNNLDEDGRAAIAALIATWRGGVVVASHDRALLEQVDRIVALSPLCVEVFGGGWSAYAAAREAERARAAAELARADRDYRAVGRAVQRQQERKARRDKAGRAWRAKGIDGKTFLDAEQDRAERTAGRDRALSERLIEHARTDRDAARERVEVVTPVTMSVPSTGLAADRRLVRLDRVVLDRGGRRILGPLSFELRGPERLLLAGANGSGKTSVLSMIRGALTPSGGSVWTAGRPIALLDQHIGLLDNDAALVDNYRARHPAVSDRDARAALARFGFRNRFAERAPTTMSGGERMRAGLACVLGGAEPPQLLLLDEPTNHLDTDAVAALEQALRDYDGGLIVASHDPAFRAAIRINRTVAIG